MRGWIPEQPWLPNEPHPGIPGWLPPYAVPHAGLTLSQRPSAIQGIPRRRQTRKGVRAALPEATPPPVFAFLLARIQQTPQGPVGPRVLVAQTQPPLGIYH